MRKKVWIGALLCIVLCCAALCLFIGGRDTPERQPFRELKASDIAAAEVRLSPPDVTVPVTDLERLAELLRAVEIGQQDNSWREYAGQAVVFTLTMTDGTTRTVVAFSPFAILDGVGYRAEYDPCEALNRFANELLEPGQ